jgi:hypothetical protein
MSDRDAQITEALERSIDAFNRQDFDRAIELAHPEIEFLPPGGQSPYRGAEGVRAWMEPDAFSSTILELRGVQIEGNRALVHQHGTMVGAGSGIELEIDSWSVWSFDDELRVTRIETFLPHEEEQAREAFGRNG